MSPDLRTALALPPAEAASELRHTRENIALHQTRFGITGEIVSELTALRRWRDTLQARGSEELMAHQLYLKEMGYLPHGGRALRNALRGARGHDAIEAAYRNLAERVYAGDCTLGEILGSQRSAKLTAQFPALRETQLEFLRDLVRHQRDLDALKLSDLGSQFPFAITKHGYFGRFVASALEDPAVALRHLRLAAPFFVRINSLLESLMLPHDNWLVIQVDAPRSGGKLEPENCISDQRHRHKRELIFRVVDNAAELQGNDAQGSRRLAAITVPPSRSADFSHLGSNDRQPLALEFFDWLFYGKRNGPLMTKVGLPVIEENELRRLTRTRARIVRSLARYAKLERRTRIKAQRQITQKERELRAAKTRTQEKIEDLEKRRRACRSVLQQLEQSSLFLRHAEKMRADIRKAEESGAVPVLSLLWPGEAATEMFCDFVCLALSARSAGTSAGARLLRQSPVLLSAQLASEIEDCDEARLGLAPALERRLRPFVVETPELNDSVSLILDGATRGRRANPRLTILTSALLALFAIPGIEDPAQFRRLVREASGKRKPEAEDYLIYTFEHLAAMPEDKLVSVLLVMRSLGIERLPPRCEELSRERFMHPSDLLQKFYDYSTTYRPKQTGRIPEPFLDRADFKAYRGAGVAAYGLAREVAQLEDALTTSGLVAVVDGTNYFTVVADAEGKEAKVPPAQNGPNYAAPVERLMQAFAVRLMEGNLGPALSHHSLLSVSDVSPEERRRAIFLKMLFGVETGVPPELAELNQVMAELSVFDSKTILILDASKVSDAAKYAQLVRLLQAYQLKVILLTKESLPGVPQVLLEPFAARGIGERLLNEREGISRRLAVSLGEEAVQFAAQQVRTFRTPDSDALDLSLRLLDGAARVAKLSGDDQVGRTHVVRALPAIFQLPDAERVRSRINVIDRFVEEAPKIVLGQQDGIEAVARRLSSHLLGLRDPTRPLTMLLAGPTGVGKTELMMMFGREADLPFFLIEGAQFSESHTISRLTGSPTGYVGADKGPLYKFLESTPSGIVFIDEIEKMHSGVYTALMNFFDRAALTAGTGEVVQRPGMIIVGASNAGAEMLRRGMSERKVSEILTNEFRDPDGKRRPELVARFEPVMMLSIDESSFRDVISLNLQTLGNRFGVLSSNLELLEIDQTASDLLFEEAKEVCAFNERALGRTELGFKQFSGANLPGGEFYHMRHVARALDTLVGASLREQVLGQFADPERLGRDKPRRMKLVGDRRGRVITLEDVAA